MISWIFQVTFCFHFYRSGGGAQKSEKGAPQNKLASLHKENKASIMTSESFKTLILQNYSQKMILVRWFIVQLGFIA